MVSWEKIARWLTFAADPITIEDWLGNRDVFGEVKKPDEKDLELERAYQLEKKREGKFGFFELDDVLLVAPETSGEAWIYGEKVEKIELIPGNMVTKKVSGERAWRVKVKTANKKVLEWSGKGARKIVFDV